MALTGLMSCLVLLDEPLDEPHAFTSSPVGVVMCQLAFAFICAQACAKAMASHYFNSKVRAASGAIVAISMYKVRCLTLHSVSRIAMSSGWSNMRLKLVAISMTSAFSAIISFGMSQRTYVL